MRFRSSPPCQFVFVYLPRGSTSVVTLVMWCIRMLTTAVCVVWSIQPRRIVVTAEDSRLLPKFTTPRWYLNWSRPSFKFTRPPVCPSCLPNDALNPSRQDGFPIYGQLGPDGVEMKVKNDSSPGGEGIWDKRAGAARWRCFTPC